MRALKKQLRARQVIKEARTWRAAGPWFKVKPVKDVRKLGNTMFLEGWNQCCQAVSRAAFPREPI